MAYLFGLFLGAVLGLTVMGSGLAWVIRRAIRSVDFNVSVGIAMLVLALFVGVANSGDLPADPAKAATFLVAALAAYFIVVTLPRRRA